MSDGTWQDYERLDGGDLREQEEEEGSEKKEGRIWHWHNLRREGEGRGGRRKEGGGRRDGEIFMK